jgi:SPP1 gp7 family putative phage head morphogenesis protein
VSFDVDFDEAIAFFRSLVQVPDHEWDRLTMAARKQSFKVAGAANLDLVQEVWEAVDRAIADGTDLRAFKREIGAQLSEAWAGSVADPGFRLETIFRTNVQTAYNAGRYEQARQVAKDRPYWLFDSIMDGRTTPDCCAALDGIVLPANDPFWKGHYPPLHFNCRSQIITLTEDQAEGMGVSTSRPRVSVGRGFGTPPSVGSWSPDAGNYAGPLWSAGGF